MTALAPDEIRRQARGAGPVVSQPRSRRGADRARAFPRRLSEMKWRRFAHALPADLRGKTVLDIGCNGGFYSIEMKRRGAERVLGVDFDDDYLARPASPRRWWALDIEFAQLSVYDVAALGERFDLVLFMGVLYHLRHPLLALDLIREHVVARPLRVPVDAARQPAQAPLEDDYEFSETAIFDDPGFPSCTSSSTATPATTRPIGGSPNRACTEAMLRSAGFVIDEQPGGGGVRLPAGPPSPAAPSIRRRPRGTDNGAAA